MIEIPLVGGASNAHQIFQIQLGDNTIEFRVNYVTTIQQWSTDLYSEGELIAAGVMLLPGSELLSRTNANIGRLVMVGDEPTLDNLGDSNKLVWVPDDE